MEARGLKYPGPRVECADWLRGPPSAMAPRPKSDDGILIDELSALVRRPALVCGRGGRRASGWSAAFVRPLRTRRIDEEQAPLGSQPGDVRRSSTVVGRPSLAHAPRRGRYSDHARRTYRPQCPS